MEATAMLVQLVIDEWKKQNKKLDDVLESIPADRFLHEMAPGKNTGIYMEGHLAAVNDGIIPLIGAGTKLYPELEAIFLRSPDKSGHSFPPLAELTAAWKAVNEHLYAYIATMQPADWLQRHTAVSETDFAKEPHRNKLNILVNRTAHQAYHLGQLAFLK
ncbi:MAG: DinB family protein [Bacteroidota bacterium]|nr:DinB family protein [Bacteroidota bacterium]